MTDTYTVEALTGPMTAKELGRFLAQVQTDIDKYRAVITHLENLREKVIAYQTNLAVTTVVTPKKEKK